MGYTYKDYVPENINTKLQKDAMNIAGVSFLNNSDGDSGQKVILCGAVRPLPTKTFTKTALF